MHGRYVPITLAFLLAIHAAPSGAQDPVPCSDVSLPTVGCPDLIVDPRKMRDAFVQQRFFSAASCSVQEGMVEPGLRTLIRFTFTTPNVGTGDLIVGRPGDHPEWFEWHDCHGHYHFREYADYRLWTRDGYALWALLRAAHPTSTAQDVLAAQPELLDHFVAGHKQGFCVIDIVPYVPAAPRNYGSCTSNQGISVGWADEYVWSLDGQWIDVTGLAPGGYVLEAEVNAERLFEELNYSNNAAAIPFSL